ncbi:MAG TPA: hypothetical protein VGF68_08420 [Solirubrobacteraceae bacterium]
MRSTDRVDVAGHVLRAALAATALVLVSAWLALPSPAVAATQFPLTVTLAGGGTGSVHDTNFDISCPTACSAAFDQGSQVVLVASPDSGSTFAGWSGAGCSGTQSCIVTMNAAENVTATFAVIPPPVQFTLTVHVAGGGAGSVHDTKFNITCPTDCSSAFGQGDEVVLVASPEIGSTFVGWSGAGCSGTQSCIVTMNADEAVTATFLQPGHGTITAPVPKTRRHGQIRAKITMSWRWNARRTVLTRMSFSHLPATARILTTCKGKRCPFKTRTGSAGGIKAFEHSLVGSAFVTGDKLMLTISAPKRRAERAQVTIRRLRIPRAQLLR